MKKIIIYSAPVAISLIWLIFTGHTFNPFVLKGPDFLRFYLILLFGFYASVLILKISGEAFSKAAFYGMIFIFILGVLKLIRGMVLEKPVGFLMLILILEFIVLMIIKQSHVNLFKKQKFPDGFKK
ncbi:hypothetical protein FY557_03960 [Chryseobacterium sp. SN22]|uniref:hypothetical protein n=1 Tax=Chryseobacterium sp. SN22 TaxID=2606431 RepID=UPI0011EDD973|nr:hypothetical protein [Chryseobacterium sp. SN22]KAA0129874.1 hypothetical protein FY557_03960 [Chryseobacterium sp. SN22]